MLIFLQASGEQLLGWHFSRVFMLLSE